MNHSIPLPTHQELATLAAAIASPGSPRDKAEAALALWEAAGEALESRRALYARALDEDQQRGARVAHADIPESGTVTLVEFLNIVLPKSKAKSNGERFAAWRRYLRHPSPGEQAPSERAADAAFARDKQNGFPAGSVPFVAEAFAKWHAGDKARTLSTRGKTGAAAKHSPKKDLETSAIAQKRNKQRKTGTKQESPGAKQAKARRKQRETGI